MRLNVNNEKKEKKMLYPTLTKTRSLYDLSGLWQFKLGDHNPEDCLSTEDVMVVPTSFNDVVVDKDKRNYIGDFWYERLVDLPKLAKDDELVLRFGSVTHNATVYVNGRELASHKGGFTPFEVVVPEDLYQDHQIRISVRANNILDYSTLPVGNYSEECQEDGSMKKVVKENFDFFNYAGIHRPVKLVARPKTHISDITITSDLSDDLKTADLSIAVETSAAVDAIQVTILDETVALLSKLDVDKHIDVEIKLDELDLTSAESKATYAQIKEYVWNKFGLKVPTLYIAQIKKKCGIKLREHYNKSKKEKQVIPQCTPEKEEAIMDALRHFKMI